MSDVTLTDIQLELLKIESQMDRVGGWNVHDRWKSGRLLISLRSSTTHYLPKGRLMTVAATLKVSTRELSDRMRVADSYRTDAAFKKAARSCGTWTDLLRSLPPTREARTGSTRPPRAWSRLLYESLAHVVAEGLLDADGLRLAQHLYDHLAIVQVDGEEQDAGNGRRPGAGCR
jgi:hypothetical protein